jgi:putative hydrolase of the HAD superfamily
MGFPVRAVTFDLWQTLMLDSKAQAAKRGALRAERIHEALARAGLPIGLQTVEHAVNGIWQVWQTTYWGRDVDPGFEAQIAWLVNQLGLPAENTELVGGLRAGYVEPIFELPPRIDDEALPTLSQLRAVGAPIGLICNTSVTPAFALRKLFDAWGLNELLSVQLFSDELGIRKPDPEIFAEAARQLGVEVESLLHVGDSPEIDVRGANDAGAQGLLIGPEKPLSQVVSMFTSS